jgi:hypothetical protein
MGTLVLLDLMGGHCLAAFGACTWSKAGPFERSVPICVRLLSKALLNRFAAFGAGAGLTALLQSSTATGLMTASFAAEGVVGLVPALAISEQDSAGRKRAAVTRLRRSFRVSLLDSQACARIANGSA